MSKTAKSGLLALTTVFLWSSAFPLTKIVTEYIQPNQLGFLRCTIAAVLLLIIGRINKISVPKKSSHVVLYLISGGMGFSLYMITFNSGMLTLTSAVSSLIIATVPVLTAIGATVIYKERIKTVGWLSIAMAFAGVAILLLWGEEVAVGSGIKWIGCAALVFCGYNLMNRKLLSLGYNAVECVTWSMVCGAILLLPFSMASLEQVADTPLGVIMIVVYLGCMPSATAYLLWSKAFSLADKMSDVTNYQFLTPLISTVLGLVMLGEVPGLSTLAGGCIIVAAIVIFGKKGK